MRFDVDQDGPPRGLPSPVGLERHDRGDRRSSPRFPVGGAFRFVERRRGTPTCYAGRYLGIVPPQRLAFTFTAGRWSRIPYGLQLVPDAAVRDNRASSTHRQGARR